MATLASIAVSALLAWYLTTPIRVLRHAFDAVAAGRLYARVTPRMGRRRDEIADLGRDFDRMAGRLQSLMSARKRLLHDVSHELRSPLARLQAAVGLLRQDAARADACVDRIEKECVRLDVMVAEVLTLARLETDGLVRGSECVSITELVRDIVDDAGFEAQSVNKSVCFECTDEVTIPGNAELLHRAIENVVRNAVKFTREGTRVQVSMHADRTAGRLTVTVADQGPGMPADDLDRAFAPFYRGAAMGSASGFGLGLAIAQGAIAAHGGSIIARNVSDVGLAVEISLPLA